MYEELRNKSIELINKYISEDISIKIEEGIKEYSLEGRIDDQINIMLYTITVVKILENLKNPYVIECIKNKIWKPQDLATFDKDTLNPKKWQNIQDLRLPKNIKKEKVKGLYKCKKCHSFYTTFTTAQTRSADEPASIFIYCNECEYRWKIN